MDEHGLPEEFALLVSHLAQVADPRYARGKVHRLGSVLSLTVLGLMAGCTSLSAISRFGKLRGEVLAGLGLRRSPSVATLSRLLRMVSTEEVRQRLLEFVRELHAQRGEGPIRTGALDGKVVRGVWEGGRQLHMLQVFAREGCLALDGMAVKEGAGEIAGAREWIRAVSKEFPALKVLTGDALLADADLCSAILEQEKE